MPAYLSTNYHEAFAQQEILIEHILPLAKIKIIDNNPLSKEDYEKIEFQVEDKLGRSFNLEQLSKLFENGNESIEFKIELFKKDNSEAVAPYKFIFRSKELNIAEIKFTIGWKNKE